MLHYLLCVIREIDLVHCLKAVVLNGIQLDLVRRKLPGFHSKEIIHNDSTCVICNI